MTDLVTVGEAILRLSPRGDDRLEAAREFSVRIGGAEATAAVAAGRLGASPVWISKLPDTPLGRRVVGELAGYGVETDVVWSEEGRQGLYFYERGGDPRGTTRVTDREGTSFATATAEELPTEHFEADRMFFATGVTPALSNRLAETTANLFSAARRAEMTAAFDLRYRPSLWDPDRARAMVTKLFPAVDVLLATSRDARRVFEADGEPRQLAHQLASKWDFDTVVVTGGEGEAIALDDGVVHEQPAYAAETVDPTGAGDAFTGAFLARRLAGEDIGTALEWAAAAAALKRTIPGDVPAVTEAEVRRVVEAADGEDSSSG